MIEPEKPLVWIVILHWRGAELTDACLESVEKLTYVNFKTLVVDNGAPAGDIEYLRQKHPTSLYLALGKNFGFAGGCNRGIEHALQQGADFIWLLNNDATVLPDALEKIVSIAAANAKVGAVGAMVVNNFVEQKPTDGPGTLDFIKAKTKTGYGKLGASFKSVSSGDHRVTTTSTASDSVTSLSSVATRKTIHCDWLHGSNLLLRREALEEVGLFDERYFLYFEDADLCYRLTLKNWSCLFLAEPLIAHIGNASTQDKRRYWRAYYYIRNRFLFFDIHSKGMAKISAKFFMMAHVVRHSISLPLKGEHGRNQLRAELLGAADYFRGALGEAKCLEWCEPN